jgi:adenylate cyclase
MLGIVALVSIVLGLVLWATDALHRQELDTVDARFDTRGTEQAPSDLIVVQVDDKTFGDLGLQWPFPRSVHGDLVDQIRKAGAKTIAYDIQFTEQTKPREDLALFDALGRARPLHPVLSTTEVGAGGSTNVLGGDENLRTIGARAANANLPPDPGGVNRRFSYSDQGLISFGVATAEAATGEEVDPGDFPEGGAWIDYHGPPGTMKTASFSDVLAGKGPVLKDAVVVVGAAAPSLQDVHPTSSSGDELMSGPEIQANVISSVRRGLPLKEASGWVQAMVIILAGLVPTLLNLRIPPLRALAAALAAGALYIAGTQLAFNGGLILSVVYPISALVLSTVGTLGTQYLAAAFERQRTRDTFSRFVPENVVNQVLSRADEELRLGGVETQATILFSDIRGFTTFSESHPAAQVVEILNRYLTAMSDAILEHGGTITTYIGDGIMAVFGAPIEYEDHADRAVAAAREMLGSKLGEFNEWLKSEGFEEFRMGVGVNSGLVMTGNVGSDRRMEYTAIGDAVNTSARMEGMTKGTPHTLFISDSTKAMLRQQPKDLVYVDDLPVRGRQTTVKVWSLDEATDPSAKGTAGGDG